MTSSSTVCPSCGEEVPFGRRTCEACGADVTGVTHVMETAIEDVPAEAAADEEEAAPAGVDEWDTPAADVQWPGDRPATDAWVTGPPAPEPASSAPAASHEPELIGMERAAPERQTGEREAAPFIPPVLREWNAGSPMPETGFAAELAAAEAEHSGLAGSWLPPSATPGEALSEAPRREYRPADAQPATSHAVPHEAAESSSGGMPATLAAMLNRTSTETPRWPTADGAGHEAESHAAVSAAAPMAPASRMQELGRAMPPGAAASPQPSIEPGRSPLFADLPFDAPNTLPGWLVAGGGALATVSFLLPWVAVIDSYFSAWGLGSIANIPAFLVVFGTTALAILPSRLADWFRHGILGLAVGSFILGLTWWRLVGATGAQLGVILEGTGALLLLIGGILAIVHDRGATDGAAERR